MGAFWSTQSATRKAIWMSSLFVPPFSKCVLHLFIRAGLIIVLYILNVWTVLCYNLCMDVDTPDRGNVQYAVSLWLLILYLSGIILTSKYVRVLMNQILKGKCVCLKCTDESWELGQWEFPPFCSELSERLAVKASVLQVNIIWRSSSHLNSASLSFILPFIHSSLPPLLVPPGLSQEKVATFLKRLRGEPRYLLAQNVSTCIDPLEVCLHRQTVQDTVHIFQHSIPTEGKPITNQKNSGAI